LARFLKITEVAQIFGPLFSKVNVFELILTKTQTHLVTLPEKRYFPAFRGTLKTNFFFFFFVAFRTDSLNQFKLKFARWNRVSFGQGGSTFNLIKYLVFRT
jgi:hypothetical protein